MHGVNILKKPVAGFAANSLALFALPLCMSWSCRSEHGGTPPSLTISSPSVRSCDIELQVSAPTKPQFSDAVLGTTLTRGARIAVAFAAKEDSAIRDSPVRFEPDGNADSEPPSIELISSTCYDRLGKVVREPGVRLRSR